MEQQSDSGEYQVDGKQEHSEVFGDVHGAFLRQRLYFCTPKIACYQTSLNLRGDQNRVAHSVQELLVRWRDGRERTSQFYTIRFDKEVGTQTHAALHCL